MSSSLFAVFSAGHGPAEATRARTQERRSKVPDLVGVRPDCQLPRACRRLRPARLCGSAGDAGTRRHSSVRYFTRRLSAHRPTLTRRASFRMLSRRSTKFCSVNRGSGLQVPSIQSALEIHPCRWLVAHDADLGLVTCSEAVEANLRHERRADRLHNAMGA